MAKTAAERQREYRQRHLKDVDGKLERLNLLIDVAAKARLDRLASHYGVTKRAALERVLAEAERRLLDALSHKEQTAYYDQRTVTA
jgi:hypothetical protein